MQIQNLEDLIIFFFSSRRRHTRCSRDWSSDVCSSDLRDLRKLEFSTTQITGGYGRRVATHENSSDILARWRKPKESTICASRDRRAIEKVAPRDGPVHAQLFFLMLIGHRLPPVEQGAANLSNEKGALQNLL